ncbi:MULTISPECIES: cytochrome c [Pseudoxanthomonas]|jgi:Cytochrome c556|uniref:Cytochrome c556 n=1 Tax=Pseudoxanthomonas taiwanensis J19 TaxID=935569 RepID=A0A562D7Y4_9GAMM|nr:MULTISPECIES: cytochrome c [Pseudoxanthomonas]TWH05905.1 Cytochrome c556 [Pseudoxanthomonas taiwanensis J19]
MASQPNRPSPAARYLVVFAIGLLVGVVAAVMALRALKERQDPFPDALMNVMARQTQELKATAAANRCAVHDALPRLQSLRAMANDLETAFPGLRDDQRFAGAASSLRANLDQALAAPPSDCAQITATLEKIGGDCRACHQDFR